jgi:hypothetical protein
MEILSVEKLGSTIIQPLGVRAPEVQRQRFNGLAAMVGRKAPPVKIWRVGADVRCFSLLRTIRVVAGFGRSQVEMVLKPR